MATAAVATRHTAAIEPVGRKDASKRLRLSLAAYSLRGQLSGKNPKMTLNGFVDYAAKLDLDAVELTSYFFPKKIDDPYLYGLKRRCHINGLDVSGGAIRNVFTLPDGPALEKWFAHVQLWLDHYAKVGAPVIRVFAGNPPKGTSEKVAVDNAIKNLRRACKMAGERGIILGLENHDFLMHVDRLQPIIEQVDSPWFGVNFDSGNIIADDPYAAMAKIAPYTVNAQIKVQLRRDGKKEATDLNRVVKILADAGYRGYIVLEYEEGDPIKAIPGYLAGLRTAIEKA
jgi:sugar phosphate isomerase/epimerase